MKTFGKATEQTNQPVEPTKSPEGSAGESGGGHGGELGSPSPTTCLPSAQERNVSATTVLPEEEVFTASG